MSEGSKRKRAVRLKPGDVFEFTVPDGRLGYGVVVLERRNQPYVIILKSLHAAQARLEDLISDEIALVGWTMDALVYHGRWRVVMKGYPRRTDIPYPNWKLGLDGGQVTDFSGDAILGKTRPEEAHLDYQWSNAPITFQSALEAIHGLREWQDYYDQMLPANMAKQMTR